MKEVLLIKLGEVVLKGLNRRSFEYVLLRNIRKSLKQIGNFNVSISQSTIYVSPADDESDMDSAVEKISKIFGIAAFSRACVAQKNMNDIKLKAEEYLRDKLEFAKTFKVESKRADKHFPMKSPEISADVGGHILEKFPNIKVDVHNPDVTIMVEIRESDAYISAGAFAGAGGLPVGTSGKAMILISGGIDSPVAAWMMAKRGVQLKAIHFASPPYTSPRAEQKVHELLEKVSLYSGNIELITVPFTEIQENIKNKCPEEFFTIIMRRMMMQIAQKLAIDYDCKALITGESLGQVASQTMHAIACTQEPLTMPVFRPLIGMDKDEIVSISRKINTFDISIQPYEDCCTVFTPKHPKTKPILKYVKQAEAGVDFKPLIDECIKNVKVLNI